MSRRVGSSAYPRRRTKTKYDDDEEYEEDEEYDNDEEREEGRRRKRPLPPTGGCDTLLNSGDSAECWRTQALNAPFETIHKYAQEVGRRGADCNALPSAHQRTCKRAGGSLGPRSVPRTRSRRSTLPPVREDREDEEEEETTTTDDTDTETDTDKKQKKKNKKKKKKKEKQNQKKKKDRMKRRREREKRKRREKEEEEEEKEKKKKNKKGWSPLHLKWGKRTWDVGTPWVAIAGLVLAYTLYRAYRSYQRREVDNLPLCRLPPPPPPPPRMVTTYPPSYTMVSAPPPPPPPPTLPPPPPGSLPPQTRGTTEEEQQPYFYVSDLPPHRGKY